MIEIVSFVLKKKQKFWDEELKVKIIPIAEFYPDLKVVEDFFSPGGGLGYPNPGLDNLQKMFEKYPNISGIHLNARTWRLIYQQGQVKFPGKYFIPKIRFSAFLHI